jgi:chromosome transmission fidelity protein 1
VASLTSTGVSDQQRHEHKHKPDTTFQMENTKRREFSHPYTPYPIQVDFMEALYDCIESYKVGIFESPTGTGKTLSLICGSMTWLRKNKAQLAVSTASADENEPAWVLEQTIQLAREEFSRNREMLQKRLDKMRRKNMRARISYEQGFKRAKKAPEPVDDSQFLPEDYSEVIKPEVQRLLSALAPPVENDFQEPVKIIFASRTHSQLSQFVGQLQHTTFPPSSDLQDLESTKLISLGSRKQLCINPRVSHMNSVQAMNDACRDLREGKKGGCKYYKNPHDALGKVDINTFRDTTLAEILDIEDLYKLGKHTSTCPYYASRASIPASEVITVPYQILLSRSARKAIDLPVKNSIVIIDEAHNLLDTITSLHTMSITKSQVSSASSGLQKYQHKFQNRLNSGNRVNLGYLVNMLQALEVFFEKAQKFHKKETAPGTPVTTSSLFDGSTADLINVNRLEKYIDESKIVFKIESYLEHVNGETQEKSHSSSLVLSSVMEFLRQVNNPDSEGVLCFDGPTKLKYQLLDPSEPFKDIVENARCVVLAGGTMEPTGDYLEYLLPYLSQDQIKLFSCGHVIPPQNLSVQVIPNGPNYSFNFTFDKRNDEKMILDVAITLLVYSKIIPEGMVVFFPSYKYLEQVVAVWKKAKKDGKNIYEILNDQKRIFVESQHDSVEKTLSEYAEEVPKGAILLSVVGGKMSEGINFSDGLARAVFMIGLPFPNLMSAEIIAKRKYIEQSVSEKMKAKGVSAKEALEASKGAARDFYMNICLRAVNQSVGRAIRHANDYACIFLLDGRFGKPEIQKKLSKWMREGIREGSFKEALGEVQQFFASHEKN